MYNLFEIRFFFLFICLFLYDGVIVVTFIDDTPLYLVVFVYRNCVQSLRCWYGYIL